MRIFSASGVIPGSARDVVPAVEETYDAFVSSSAAVDIYIGI